MMCLLIAEETAVDMYLYGQLPGDMCDAKACGTRIIFRGLHGADSPQQRLERESRANFVAG